MAEREWREAVDLRVSKAGLAAVLLSAAVLRLWALGHGIPHALAVDEPEIVERAFNMMRSGSFHPHFFDYPTLTIYLQLIVSIARFVFGAITGAWQSLDGATIPSFYLWGRAVTASLGVATVFLLFQAGMRWGTRHALLAAGLLAVMPLHVTYSHYVLTDAPLTFFTTLTLVLTLVAHEKNTTFAFAVAGAAAGLAAGTKYNGGIALVMPVLACSLTVPPHGSRLLRIAIIGATSLAAFLLATPFAVLDLPQFLNTFARLSGQYRFTEITEPVWLLYLKHLRLNLGWPTLLLALGGLVLGTVRLVRGPGRVRWALIVVFPLTYFWIVSAQKIVYARYLLPMVPMLCLAASCAVVSGVSLLRRYEIPRAARTMLIVALTLAALVTPALRAIDFNRTIGKTSTADLAYRWIDANIPKGATIVLESRKIVIPLGPYNARNVKSLISQTHADYVSQGVQYLVASSQIYGPFLENPRAYRAQYSDYMTLFAQNEEVARFTPTDETPGAELRIFKVQP